MLKNPVIKFASRFCLFVIALFAVDFIVGYGLKTLYFKQKVGKISETTYAVEKADQNILIFGSSIAFRNYVPKLITQATSLSCYNLGRDGMRIPYHCAIEEVVLERKKPKLIILDLNAIDIKTADFKYQFLTVLLPYCEDHPNLVKYIENVSVYEKYKLISKTYPFNSDLFLMIYCYLFENKVEKDDFGFRPLSKALTQNEAEILLRKDNETAAREALKFPKLDVKSIGYVNQFLNLTQKNGIKTLVVISPALVPEKDFYGNELMSICKKYNNVEFVDFSKDKNFNNHIEKFADITHLNEKGAYEYTAQLAKKILALDVLQ